MFTYFVMALVAVVVLIVAVNILKGLLRGLKKSIGSLIAILLSLVVSFILTATVVTPGSSAVSATEDLLTSFGGAVAELFAIEELGVAFSHYATMLVSPIFFTLSFIVVSIVISIIVAIVIKFIPPYKKPNLLLNKLGGALVGLVSGLLVAIIIAMPIVGTVNLFTKSESVDLESVEQVAGAEVADIFSAAAESSALDIFANVGCGMLYDSLAKTNFEGEKILLKDDIGAIIEIADSFSVLNGEVSSYGAEQIAALNNIVAHLDTSPLLKNIVAGVLSEIATKWSEGNAFIGIEKLDVGETLSPLFDKLLEILSTSDKTNIVSDLQTVIDIFDVLIKNDILENAGDVELLLNKLGQDGVVSSLLSAVNKNERMLPISDEITKLGMRYLATSMGIPENSEAAYNKLMEDVAGLLNSQSVNEESFEAELGAVLENNGINVDEDDISIIADSMLSDLGSLDNVSASDVEEFFIVYSTAIPAGADETASNSSLVEFLSDDGTGESDTFVFNNDGTVSVNGRVLSVYNSSNLLNSEAYKLGENGVDIGDAATLYSSEAMKSSIITMDDISAYIASYSDCSDIEAEARKVEGVIKEAFAIFEDTDLENMDTADMLKKASALLDKMGDSEIFKPEAISGLLTGILQSSDLADVIGINAKDAAGFVDKLTQTVANSDQTYESTIKSISGTINMIGNATSDKSGEDKKKETQELIENITPESVDVISSVITSSVLENSGVKSEKTEVISTTVTSLLDNMAKYDGDAHHEEAEAVNTILDIAMNASDSTFSNGEETGSVGKTADEFIDIVVNSDVVSGTIVDVVNSDSFESQPSVVEGLTEEEQGQLAAALEDYYANGAGDAELLEKLEAIASFLNVNANFN